MTVQELQEIMSQRFDRVEDDVKGLRGDMNGLREKIDSDMNGLREKIDSDIKGLRGDMNGLREKIDSDIKGLREEIGSDMNGLRADMKELREKVDKVLELQYYQRGQREFSSRFLKHAAWAGPTIIALIALIKSFFL